VGFLHEGRLLAFGPVQEVYNNPPNLEVGTYFSYPSMNVFDGTPKSENGKLLLRVSDELKVDVSHLADKLKDESCFLGIRAHDVHTTKPEGSNIEIKAQVDLLEVVGSDVELHLTHQGISFISLMSEFAGLFEIRMGDTIPVYLDPSCFFIFSKKDHKLVAKTS
jgi:ABC-type sugar transport system ATPase subunit